MLFFSAFKPLQNTQTSLLLIHLLLTLQFLLFCCLKFVSRRSFSITSRLKKYCYSSTDCLQYSHHSINRILAQPSFLILQITHYLSFLKKLYITLIWGCLTTLGISNKFTDHYTRYNLEYR